MVNGLSVLGWGVGGIEAEAAMLGQPISMLLPEVVGFRLVGKLREGATATDLVLTVTQMLRRRGVVGRFVEYCGPGIAELALADRATIGNMAPEYGATCGFFPIDAETIRYLTITARDPARVKLVEAYAKAQGLWRDANTPDPAFTDMLELDLGTVEPSLAGPRRPQDRVSLSGVAAAFDSELPRLAGGVEKPRAVRVEGTNYELHDGDVVIAAITSCTNTSNPSVMLAAGLLAKKAVEKGLKVKPWVKTSLAPGSQVVSDYYEAAGLQAYLDQVGFNLVGYGCTTCIGNSGPLPEPVSEAIDEGDLAVCAVLSGNRNFEGRIHAQVRANYLASPPLVVAYALAGSIRHDLATEPLGEGGDGKPVYLRDIWPTNQEVDDTVARSVKRESFQRRYGNVFEGPPEWRAVPSTGGMTYQFEDRSTYLALPPYFENMPKEPAPIQDVIGARELAIFGDSITTDHISPAGSIRREGPAGEYLISYQVRPVDFNTYGSQARQPPRDDARHLRQHPHTQRDGARDRGRHDQAPAGRHGHADLRRGDGVQKARRAAGDLRRQGIRHRVVARLGSQGHAPARGQGGRRRELRAHPPLEPGRHGGPAAAIPRRGQPSEPEADRRGDDRHHRRRRRDQAANGADDAHPRPGWHGARGEGDLPHRHARRGRILPPRRDFAIRAAQPRETGGLTAPLSPRKPLSAKEG